MKLDPGMHIGLHLVFFGKSGVTLDLLEKHLTRLAHLLYRALSLCFTTHSLNMLDVVLSTMMVWM
jgi:hypothetical protein